MNTVLSPRKEFLARLALVFGSLLVLFLIGEIVCRLFFPDRQLRYSSDEDALWYFAPNQYGTVTLGSGAPSPFSRTNELGLRGPGLRELESRRILLLGDSFTFGQGVPDDSTFAAVMDRLLGDSISVVNGGQLGYGVFQMQALLERVASDLVPELVVMVIWQGDFLRRPPTPEEREEHFRQKRLLDVFKSSLLVTHLYRQIEPLLKNVPGGALVIRAGDIGTSESGRSSSVIDAHLRGLEDDLARIRRIDEIARDHGRGLLLALWTKEGFAELPQSEVGLADSLGARLSKFARENSIPFVSLRSALDSLAPEDLLIPQDGHPTVLAHCLAAHHLAAAMAERGYPVRSMGGCRR